MECKKSPLLQTRGAVQHAVQIAEVTQALLEFPDPASCVG